MGITQEVRADLKNDLQDDADAIVRKIFQEFTEDRLKSALKMEDSRKLAFKLENPKTYGLGQKDWEPSIYANSPLGKLCRRGLREQLVHYKEAFLKENPFFSDVIIRKLDPVAFFDKQLLIVFVPAKAPSLFAQWIGKFTGVGPRSSKAVPKLIESSAGKADNLEARALGLKSQFDNVYGMLQNGSDVQKAAQPLKDIFEKVVIAARLDTTNAGYLNRIFKNQETLNGSLKVYCDVSKVSSAGELDPGLIKTCKDIAGQTEKLLSLTQQAAIDRQHATLAVLSLRSDELVPAIR